MRKIFYVLMILCSGIFLLGFYHRYQKNKHENLETSIKHLAIIMDGNRRWAKQRGLQPWIGHQQGIHAVKKSIEFCVQHHIPYLSLYVFSLENFKRSHEELQYLFDVIAQELIKTELDNLFKQNIKINFIGDRTKFPSHLRETISSIEQKTDNNTDLTLSLLFCYGGRQELVDVMQQIAQKIAQHEITPHDISEDYISHFLWTQTLPDPDLIIRTGGAQRLSNFLPYQSVYSELYFFDCYWPDFDHQHLEEALHYYEQSKRNFGA